MDEKTIELLKFTVNEKANNATRMRHKRNYDEEYDNFWKGQYMAFNEVYSLLCNLNKEEIIDTSSPFLRYRDDG